MAINTLDSLLTLNDVKSYLSTTSTDHDARFNDIINAVSGMINTYTNRKLKARYYSSSGTGGGDPEYRDGHGGNALYMRQYPINTLSTDIIIIIDRDRNYTDTDDQVGSTDIIIYADEGKIVIDNDIFDPGEKSVKISYNAGFTITTSSAASTDGSIPYDLQYAAKEYVRFLWKREKGDMVGIRSESVEGASIVYETDMPWSVKKILDIYRKPHG